MDFDWDQAAESPKKEETEKNKGKLVSGFPDHSLDMDTSGKDDFLHHHQPHMGPSASDDFEHIISGEKVLDTDEYLIGNSFVSPPEISSRDSQNLLDGFSFTEAKAHDDIGFGSPAHQKTATIDFMQAERHFEPLIPKTEPISTPTAPPAASSILDEIEDDYLNPYATTKVQDKFISSEDLLDDFKEPRTQIPESLIESSTRKIGETAVAAASSISAAAFDAEPLKPLEPLVPVQCEPVKPAEVPKKEEKKVEKLAPEPQPKQEEVKPAKKAEIATKSKESMIAAEEMFCKIGLGKFSS